MKNTISEKKNVIKRDVKNVKVDAKLFYIADHLKRYLFKWVIQTHF